MTTDLPPVPPAVMEFAEQHNIKKVQQDEIFYIRKELPKYKNVNMIYCGYSDNMPKFEKNKNVAMYNHFTFIIDEKDNIRLATPEETEELNRVLFL